MNKMDRVKVINDISSILEESRQELHQILKKIGWDKEGLQKDEKEVVCPIDSSHVMPSSSLSKHLEKCRMKKECIDPKDVCPSSHFFYKNSLAVVPVLLDGKKYESFKSIKKEPDRSGSFMKGKNQPWECIPSDLDDIVQGSSSTSQHLQGMRSTADQASSTKAQEIKLPKVEKTDEAALRDAKTTTDIRLPMSRVPFDLSAAQRLAVYDYVVQAAKAIKRHAAEEELEDLQHLAENAGELEGKAEDAPKSHLDTLAELRDYKRRRQSYRAKNVHMTKRTNVEIMRDLIDTQMKMLEELNRKEPDSPKSARDGSQRTRFDDEESIKKESSKEHDKYRERRKGERQRERDSPGSKYSLEK